MRIELIENLGQISNLSSQITIRVRMDEMSKSICQVQNLVYFCRDALVEPGVAAAVWTTIPVILNCQLTLVLHEQYINT